MCMSYVSRTTNTHRKYMKKTFDLIFFKIPLMQSLLHYCCSMRMSYPKISSVDRVFERFRRYSSWFLVLKESLCQILLNQPVDLVSFLSNLLSICRMNSKDVHVSFSLLQSMCYLLSNSKWTNEKKKKKIFIDLLVEFCCYCSSMVVDHVSFSIRHSFDLVMNFCSIFSTHCSILVVDLENV